MAINILMPALSPTMESGNLAKWLKKEGDAIKAGDILAEIETDKATMEVEAVDEGTLGKILVPAGSENVAINQPIAVLLEEGEDAGAIQEATAVPPPPSRGPTVAAPSPPSPPAREAAAAPSAAPRGTSSVPPSDHAAAGGMAPTAAAKGNGKAGGRVLASPLARRLASEASIDIAEVSGSGPHGRVVRADIEAVKSGRAPRAAPAGAPSQPTVPLGQSDAQIMRLYEPGSYEVVPHDNVRRIVARRLVEAKQTIPHFYLTIDTEIDALLALRAQINDAAPQDADGKPQWKVSVNDLIIKALALALRRVPDANVTWTEGGMLHHKRSDVGVAVAIKSGLITPVVRRANEKRVSQIAIEMKDYAARARTRKLMPEEYQGGSTAVSNLGMYGVKDFAAVINPPHATILAVGAGIPTPVVRDGKVEVRTIMTVTLSTDHRAVDGALGAELLGAFKTLIETPAGMLA